MDACTPPSWNRSRASAFIGRLARTALLVAACGCAASPGRAGDPSSGFPALRPAARPAAPSAALPSAALSIPLSDADRRHLLSRTGIGVAPDDYAALAGLTRAEGIERIVEGLRTEPVHAMPGFARRPLPHHHARDDMDAAARGAFDRMREGEVSGLRRWWAAEMLDTDSPQTERLVWLLSDLFATSVDGTDRSALAMARQNATFRRMHSGSWEALLHAMLRDAALLEFLNAGSNRRDAPNENLARELLERFTLGDGEYDEATVREAARALTGHGTEDVADLAFRLRTWQRDGGDKTLFGVTGPHDGDDLVRLILAQPAAARWPARLYWHAYVDDAPPGDAELDALASAFRDSGHDLGALYRATLESEAFWAPAHRGASIKSPVDIVVGLARTLEYPKAHVDSMPALLAELGQSPLAPPDVGGWDEGAAWVAPGRLLARYAAVDALAFAKPAAGPGTGDGAGAGTMMNGAMGMGSGDDGALVLTLASDALDGPVRIGVTLLADGAALWDSGVHALSGGHDTATFGPSGGGATRAWRAHRLEPPADAVAAADEVRVSFVNDFADARGDRNLYVDRATLGGRRALAALGRQASACPPVDPGSAGEMWCAGTLSMHFEPSREAVPVVPAGRLAAAAARLRWADVDPDAGTASATFLLEHVRPPAVPDAEAPGEGVSPDAGAIELLQFRLVREIDGRLDLRLDSFDCRGPCVRDWPACAWTDEHFPATRVLSLTLVPRSSTGSDAASDPGRRCVERELEPHALALFAALEAAVPALVRALDDGALARRRPEAWAAVRASVEAAVAAGLPDAPDGALVIAPGLAPIPFEPDPPVPVAVRVDSPGALTAASAPLGLDPVELLLPGMEGLQAPPPGAPVEARLRAVLESPAFQLR